MKRLLAIDPGAKGGLAFIDSDGIVQAEKMPEGMTAQVDRLRELKFYIGLDAAVMEKVGFHVAGNAASSSAKFARHCGHLEAALYTLGIPYDEVLPTKWMKSMGALPKDKKQRKNAIKETMARRYPHLKVTLDTADALAILTWAVEK